MVRAEDRRKETGMARDISRSANAPKVQEEGQDKDTARLKDAIDKTEREIVRLTLIAEKEKRDSIALQSRIKKLQEQYEALTSSPTGGSASPEEMRRCQSEGDLSWYSLDDQKYSATPPIPTSFRTSSSISRSVDAENTSPNISPNVSPLADSTKAQTRDITKYEALLSVKQEELARVQLRSREENARYTSFLAREDGLKGALQNEMTKRRRVNHDMQVGIAQKEKEIQRLAFLAERDKRIGMSVRDEITAQRRTLEVFAKTLVDKKKELDKIIISCDNVVVAAPGSLSPSSVSSSSPIHTVPSPLSLTPVSPPRGLASSSKSVLSPLQEEMNKLMREYSHKDEELSRVSAIAETEAARVAALKEKVEEVKMTIAGELQSLDEQIVDKIQQVHNKRAAIQKVASRAEMERARACQVQEELDGLAKVLGEEKMSGVEIKKSEYIPDKAYFSEFKELTELVPVSEIPAHSPLFSAASKDQNHGVPPLDPATFQSPKIKQISFANSQDVLSKKMRDLAMLQQETARLDSELVRLKNLKEAEVARRRLLVEKLKELKGEVEYVRAMKNSQGREVSRTF